MPRKWRISEKAKQKRRKVLPGFPWEGTFQTKEEVDAYFADDKIQCLLCGKWYHKLSGSHLLRVHDMFVDEYRQRYGLPWKRGLTGRIFYKKQSDLSKRLIAEGRMVPLDGKNKQIQQKAHERPRRPLQPFELDSRKKLILTKDGHTTTWQWKDYEAILTRMQKQQRTLWDVCQDQDLPGESSWGRFVKKHPEFAERVQQVYFSLPYSIQLRSRHKISPQFQIDCQRLRAQGMTKAEIAKTLGVSVTAVNRVLPWTKPVRKRLTINEMQQIAERRGGKCLSETYIDNRTKLLWECEQGHQWKATPSHIKGGRWCPACANVKRRKAKRLGIEKMRQLARNRGGRCLSETYTNNKTKLLWECAQGHQWQTLPQNVHAKGHWCPVCGGTAKGTLEEMQTLAKRRGGKCLSKKYINAYTKLLWECAKGHQWETKPTQIKQGRWCPYCGGTAKRTIEDMQRIAERRGGRCLSPTYTNIETKLVWQCANGHQWEAAPKNIVRGNWCLRCAGIRTWTIEDMQRIAERRGGRCLSPTYTNNKTKLIWQCAQGHQWETASQNILYGSWCPHCARRARGTIEEMQQLAKRRGGYCLSTIYKNRTTKLVWQCAQGHQWEAVPLNIINGTWCPHCTGRKKGTIEEMQQLAKRQGGYCLSTTYKTRTTKLIWQCAQGHLWKTTPQVIMRGSWCPHCARSKRKETRTEKR